MVSRTTEIGTDPLHELTSKSIRVVADPAGYDTVDVDFRRRFGVGWCLRDDRPVPARQAVASAGYRVRRCAAADRVVRAMGCGVAGSSGRGSRRGQAFPVGG